MNKDDLKDFITGALVIDKPVGMTSHDVVKVVRQGTGIRRAGHTGTLDPRASGVLVVLIGPAVRLSEFLSASDKRYQAILRFGVATDTYDTEGKQVGETKSVDHIAEIDFQKLLREYEGKIAQVPVMYKKADFDCETSIQYTLAKSVSRGVPFRATVQFRATVVFWITVTFWITVHYLRSCTPVGVYPYIAL